MSENKSILQALRKNVGKTQEQVAEYMDVATNTIQNWERTPSQIKEEQLCKLLDFYHATQKERKDIVLQIHRNVLCIDEENEENVTEPLNNYNFPDFLFEENPQIIEAAKNMTLSAEEMDVFGYWYHNKYKSQKIPYSSDFYESHGGYFTTMKIMEKIEFMFKGMDNRDVKDVRGGTLPSIMKDIYDFGILYPNQPYSYCSESRHYIVLTLPQLLYDRSKKKSEDISWLYEDCRKVKDPLKIGTSSQPDRKYGLVKDFVVLEKNTSNCDYQLKRHQYCETCEPELCDIFRKCSIYERCFQIEKREFTDESYLKEKKKHEEDLNEYNKHPALYDHAPKNFTPQYEYWLSLTNLGKQFVEWVEEETRQ